MTDRLHLAPETTRLEALKRIGEAFRAVGIETAQRDARLLTLDAAGIGHSDLIRAPRESIGPVAARRLSENAARRLAREPVARILGEWEFWSLPFKLSPETLVPRPDSETVVAAALIALGPRRHRNEGVRVLDLGTGSGCLLIALLHEMPGASGIGVDLSPGAVDAARRNARLNDVEARAEFRVSNWTEKVEGAFDLVVSNPPYIVDSVLEELEPEVRVHDPRLALSGGSDGLDAYRRIVRLLPGVLNPGGVAVLEIGSDQVDSVTALARGAGFTVEGPYADFGSRPRALVLRTNVEIR
jgi:release factor glutamine methyltransferase